MEEPVLDDEEETLDFEEEEGDQNDDDNFDDQDVTPPESPSPSSSSQSSQASTVSQLLDRSDYDLRERKKPRLEEDEMECGASSSQPDREEGKEPSSDFDPMSSPLKGFPQGDFTIAEKWKIYSYWRSVKSGRRAWASMQSRFKKLKGPTDRILYAWEERHDFKKKWAEEREEWIAVDPSSFLTRKDKFKELNRFVRVKFDENRRRGNMIHEIHLRRWAVLKNKELKIPDFKASGKWLKNFKSHNKIVSRKVTKFASSSDIENVEATWLMILWREFAFSFQIMMLVLSSIQNSHHS